MNTMKEGMIQFIAGILIAIVCGALGVSIGIDTGKSLVIKAEKGYYLPVKPYGWEQTRIMGEIYYRQGTILARVDK